MTSKAIITIGESSFEAPIVVGSENEKAIDIGAPARKDRVRDARPGVHEHRVDEERDHLPRRREGHPALPRLPDRAAGARSRTFVEVAYLLIYGELPDAGRARRASRPAHAPLADPRGHEALLRRLPVDGAPDGDPLARWCCSLSTYYPEDARRRRQGRSSTSRSRACIAKIRTIAAFAYKKSIGQPFVYPRNDLEYCGNFLQHDVQRSRRALRGRPRDREARSTCCSSCTPTTSRTARRRRCASSAARTANLFASIAAGICALWGPLHGGANQEVIEMLEAHPATTAATSRSTSTLAKDKNSNFRLMGFGHRVYKNFDPRAKIIKKAGDKVLAKLGINDPLLDIAKQLEEAALDGQLLRRAQAVPERRLLLGHHLPRARLPHQHVHRDVRPRPPARAGSPTGRR